MSAPSVTPEELLDSADQLLTAPIAGIGDQWPQACALLTRLALELALDRYWARTLPSAAECGMRQQLLLLPSYGGPEAALLAREAWLGLAGATHHHAYELAPTAAELRRWHTTVMRLTALLGSLPRAGRGARMGWHVQVIGGARGAGPRRRAGRRGRR
jgi:hypothetical protein